MLRKGLLSPAPPTLALSLAHPRGHNLHNKQRVDAGLSGPTPRHNTHPLTSVTHSPKVGLHHFEIHVGPPQMQPLHPTRTAAHRFAGVQSVAFASIPLIRPRLTFPCWLSHRQSHRLSPLSHHTQLASHPHTRTLPLSLLPTCRHGSGAQLTSHPHTHTHTCVSLLPSRRLGHGSGAQLASHPHTHSLSLASLCFPLVGSDTGSGAQPGVLHR
jgi:hypothetical protein